MSGRKILVIHMSRLGDTIQGLPALKLLNEENPGCSITYLGIENFCVLLKGSPWIDRLVAVPWQEVREIAGKESEKDTDAPKRFFNSIPELGERYDLLVNLTHDRNSGYLSKKVNAEEKAGRIFSKNDEIVVSGDWGKYLFALAKNRKDNLLNLVDLYMGMAGVRNRPVYDFLPPNPERDRKCAVFLEESGIDFGRPVIGFQLGANMAARRWPVKHFADLGRSLVDKFDAQIVLFGSPGERRLADAFRSIVQFPFVDLAGKTALPDLPSFFRNIDLLVGNDTGPMHIASAVGTGTVGVFMSTAFSGITGPYGAGNVAVQSRYPCFPCLDDTVCCDPLCRRDITPEAVLHGVRLALVPDEVESDCDVGADIYVSSFRSDGTLRYELKGGRTDRFLPWLTSFGYAKAEIGQALWNRWLGIENASHEGGFGKNARYLSIISDFRKACRSFGDIYERGMDASRRILGEFSRKKPNLRLVQGMAELLARGEEEIRSMEGPLPILKEMHEFYMYETEICDFPKLAREFMKTYGKMTEILRCFETVLGEIETPSADSEPEKFSGACLHPDTVSF